MHLTPKEQDKLTLLTLGMIAERRLQKELFKFAQISVGLS